MITSPSPHDIIAAVKSGCRDITVKGIAWGGGGGLLTSVIIIVRFACLLSAPAHNQRLRLEPFPLNPTKAVVILSSHGKSCQRSPIPAEVLSTTSYQVAIRLTLSLTLN